MALTIEDGTGFPTADSFVTVAEVRTWATDRGHTLPAVDADVEKLLVKAGDFILGLDKRFLGQRTIRGQRLPWPRINVVYNDGVDFAEVDEIPELVKEAQMQLTVSSVDTVLRPDGSGQEVIKEKVGPLEVGYSPGTGGTVQPRFNAALDLLAPLFRFGMNQAIVGRA